MRGESFRCDGAGCNERIEDQDSPIVVYIVAGVVPLHPAVKEGTAEVGNFPMPQIIRDMFAQPVARRDYCAECFAKTFGLPLVVPVKEEAPVAEPAAA